MFNLLALADVENTIERLSLPAFHPRAFPINNRRIHFMDISLILDDLYDRSHIDSFMYADFSARARDAYIHGGL